MPDEAVNGAAARRVRNGLPLTRKMALSATAELLEAYETPDFSRKLQELKDLRADGASEEEFIRRRRALMFSEQEKILPKYGFPGTHKGFERMMGDLEAFLKDPEIRRNIYQANERLGLRVPEDRWSTIAAACRKLQEEPRGSRAAAAPSSMPMLTMFGEVGSLDRTSVVHMAPGRPAGPMVFGSASADYEPWPPGMGRPFPLYILGSWNDNAPILMAWDKGVFWCSVCVGADGYEVFQFFQNNDGAKNYYPSIPDATPLHTYDILGPGGDNEGRFWFIGSADGSVRPGTFFEVIVEIDVNAHIVGVDWIEQS